MSVNTMHFLHLFTFITNEVHLATFIKVLNMMTEDERVAFIANASNSVRDEALHHSFRVTLLSLLDKAPNKPEIVYGTLGLFGLLKPAEKVSGPEGALSKSLKSVLSVDLSKKLDQFFGINTPEDLVAHRASMRSRIDAARKHYQI